MWTLLFEISLRILVCLIAAYVALRWYNRQIEKRRKAEGKGEEPIKRGDNMETAELRDIKFKVIVAMLNDDPQLRKRLEVYLK